MRASFPARAAATLLLASTACTRAIASTPTECARTPHEALRVPILLYHHLGEPAGKYKSLYVDPDIFVFQMEAIAHSGAATLTMSELADAVCRHRTFPHGAVAITFDDASIDQQNAFDVLRANGMHATFYIPTSRIGSPDCFSWDQLRAMQRSGLIEIGDHTMTHADLTRVTLDEARAEIAGAALAIKMHLGVVPRQFAYPYGHRTPAIEAVVRADGFATAVTTNYAWDHGSANALDWGRLEVHSTNLPQDLATLARDSGQWVRV